MIGCLNWSLVWTGLTLIDEEVPCKASDLLLMHSPRFLVASSFIPVCDQMVGELSLAGFLLWGALRWTSFEMPWCVTFITSCMVRHLGYMEANMIILLLSSGAS